jgi:hypothetical protein
MRFTSQLTSQSSVRLENEEGRAMIGMRDRRPKGPSVEPSS